MILGIDFLQAYKASINIGNGTISFFEGALETPLNTPTPAHAQNYKIKTAYSRSQTCIMVKVPESYDGQQVLIEPTKGSQKFMSAKSLDIIHSKYTSCLLLNPTNLPIHLKKDIVVGPVSSLNRTFDIQPIDGGHGRRVVTLSPPTSEAGVLFLAWPQVGKLVVACRWSAVYSTEP